jgi:hypothetical protein
MNKIKQKSFILASILLGASNAFASEFCCPGLTFNTNLPGGTSVVSGSISRQAYVKLSAIMPSSTGTTAKDLACAYTFTPPPNINAADILSTKRPVGNFASCARVAGKSNCFDCQ